MRLSAASGVVFVRVTWSVRRSADQLVVEAPQRGLALRLTASPIGSSKVTDTVVRLGATPTAPFGGSVAITAGGSS